MALPPDTASFGPDAATADHCPFCTAVRTGRERPLLHSGTHVVAFEDAFPSTVGHILVVPTRHVGRVGELPAGEHAELWLVARAMLARAPHADGFTIGVNDGAAAGQTVAHVHLHVIPRHHGDTAAPRGGIRWAIPETAAYWAHGLTRPPRRWAGARRRRRGSGPG